MPPAFSSVDRRRISVLAFAALVLAGCAGGGGGAIGVGTVSNDHPALWIGDSYTAGTGVSSSADGEAYLTSDKLGWHHTRLDAEGGTGFIADADAAARPDYEPVPARLAYDKALAPHPGVVVVDAGRNDFGYATTRLRRVVIAYFKALARAFPSSPVVVIAPFLMRSKPSDYAALRLLLRQQARHYGWAFVDPLAAGWIGKTSAKLVSGDGIHPNQAGYDYLSSHLATAIPAALAAAHERVG